MPQSIRPGVDAPLISTAVLRREVKLWSSSCEDTCCFFRYSILLRAAVKTFSCASSFRCTYHPTSIPGKKSSTITNSVTWLWWNEKKYVHPLSVHFDAEEQVSVFRWNVQFCDGRLAGPCTRISLKRHPPSKSKSGKYCATRNLKNICSERTSRICCSLVKASTSADNLVKVIPWYE